MADFKAQQPTTLSQRLKDAFLQGQGVVTQTPGVADASTRQFYSYHPGYDIAENAGTPITPNFAGEVLGTYQATTGYGLRTLVKNPQTGEEYYLSHLSKDVLPQGSFQPGQTIGYTGGVPGTPGAGNTTGAHIDITPASGGYADILASIRNSSPTAPRPQMDLNSAIATAKQKYGGSAYAVGNNPNKLASIAAIVGGRVVKL